MSLLSRLGVAAFAALSVVALSASSALAGPNLVVNGGFEDGGFFPISGWDGSGAFQDSIFFTAINPPHSGDASAAFGAVGGLDSIFQTLPTTPGEKYSLTFWLYSDGFTPNEFVVSVDGNVFFDQTDIPFHDYIKYNYQFTAASNATVLDFAGQNDPGYLSLDDVSVTAVPEPGAVAFGVIAAGSVLGMVARKRKAK